MADEGGLARFDIESRQPHCQMKCRSTGGSICRIATQLNRKPTWNRTPGRRAARRCHGLAADRDSHRPAGPAGRTMTGRVRLRGWPDDDWQRRPPTVDHLSELASLPVP